MSCGNKKINILEQAEAVDYALVSFALREYIYFLLTLILSALQWS
jgi:hypothetical protein